MGLTITERRRQDVSWTKAAQRAGVQTERAAIHVVPTEDESADTDDTEGESAQKNS